jgi:thymidine kinase
MGYGIDVYAFGILADFRAKLFPGQCADLVEP